MATGNLRRYPAAALGVLIAIVLAAPSTFAGGGKKYDDNDVTYRLFQLLDNAHNGDLDDLYLIADTYTDASGETCRHVLRIGYEKNKTFGRLAIYVRSVGKISADQASTYTPEQIYDFGEVDLQKFVKTDPGPFGQRGDLYLESSDDQALHTMPVTDTARKQYENYLSQWVIPALQKPQ